MTPTERIAALLLDVFQADGWPNLNTTTAPRIAARLIAAGVRVAPSPDAPGPDLREAARAVVDAQPMDWSVPSLHPDHIEVHENAFDALMDAIDALDRALDDTPIRTVTTPDGQVYRPENASLPPTPLLDVDTLVVAMVEAVKRVALQHGIRPTEFMDAAVAAADEVRAAQSKEPTNA